MGTVNVFGCLNNHFQTVGDGKYTRCAYYSLNALNEEKSLRVSGGGGGDAVWWRREEIEGGMAFGSSGL